MPAATDEKRPGRAPRRSFWYGIQTLIRKRLTTGLLTVLPIVLTFWLVRVIFLWMRDASLWLFELYLTSPIGASSLEGLGVSADKLRHDGLDALPAGLAWGLSILSVVMTFAAIYLVGLASANFFGRRLLAAFDHTVDRVPFVKPIYRTLKQVFELFGGSDRKQQFQRVALVPFPNVHTHSVAFITAVRHDAKTGEELAAAFVPTTPNPTTGFLFLVRRADIIEVDWTVEEAFKVIMSGGILTPDEVTIQLPAASVTVRKTV